MSSEAPHFDAFAAPVRVGDPIVFCGEVDAELRSAVVQMIRTPIQSRNILEDLRWRLSGRWPTVRVQHNALERQFYIGFAEPDRG